MRILSEKTPKFALIFAAAALALSGCAVAEESQSPLAGSDEVQASASTFSGADIMFAQMMIPHHEQALDMGVIAAAKAQTPEVLELASDISAEQGPEIMTMRSWINAAGASEDMGHAGHLMDGMLTEEQMAALLNAADSEFDDLFLRGMTAHHEGAISMAQSVLSSSNPEVRTLAEAIVVSQQEQIDYMKPLLAN